MVRRECVLVPVAARGLVLAVLMGGGLWWWAVLRLVLVPERTGLVEGAVAAGGWGLSLLPVHVTAFRGTSAGAGAGAGGTGGAVGADGTGAVGDAGGGEVTRAWRHRRSGG
ncbi:hypothetical protein ACIBCM_27985 [Streptomyces sp. NPDC051018]|uniref:hypothetical protein n=1 Tax=Streptomyces sp. NPDC051018 TaxID=3365639 RepID=UPI0037AC1A3B